MITEITDIEPGQHIDGWRLWNDICRWCKGSALLIGEPLSNSVRCVIFDYRLGKYISTYSPSNYVLISMTRITILLLSKRGFIQSKDIFWRYITRKWLIRRNKESINKSDIASYNLLSVTFKMSQLCAVAWKFITVSLGTYLEFNS